MEDKKTNGNSKDAYVCTCCSHYTGGPGGYPGMWIRILIGVIAVLVIFWLGLKVGEFRDQFAGFGYGRPGGYMMMRGGNPSMMRGMPYGTRGFGGGMPMMSSSTTPTTTVR